MQSTLSYNYTRSLYALHPPDRLIQAYMQVCLFFSQNILALFELSGFLFRDDPSFGFRRIRFISEDIYLAPDSKRNVLSR